MRKHEDECFDTNAYWPYQIDGPDLCYPAEQTPRAVRRHHRERLMIARRNYWGSYRGYFFSPWLMEHTGWLGHEGLCRVVDTPRPCSCLGCGGNPRKEDGSLTHKECLANWNFADQLEELNFKRPYVRARNWDW
jgi:hypothetical protein